MKALEKDRSRRYDTANAFARDIERHLHDEPVEACPPSATYRMRKLARKYRTPLGVAAAFVLLLIFGALVSVGHAFRATNAEIAANDERDRALTAEQQAQANELRAKAEEVKAKTSAQAALESEAQTRAPRKPRRGSFWSSFKTRC